MPSPKHRRAMPTVTRGWSRWPRHRSDVAGPASSDGLVEFARQYEAAVAIVRERRERAFERAFKAACN